MYMLQLFDADDAIAPIDSRTLDRGTIRLGRGHAADWAVADPDLQLSRVHCELSAADEGLTLRVLGANGMFDDTSGARLPDAVPVPVALPAALRMGRFRLVATDQPAARDERTMLLSSPSLSPTPLPALRAEESPLEAFCAGAGIDPSVLSSGDPAEIMRRAGEVYREMVIGLGELIAERDRVRTRHALNRTTIGSADNNPFKWGPSHRLATDLLLGGTAGFLSGPAALAASFADVRRHLIASEAGRRAGLVTAVGAFAPIAIDAAAGAHAGLLKSRAAAQMEEVAARHAALAAELESEGEGTLDRAFAAAYDETERRSA